jgi:hypothetical protein
VVANGEQPLQFELMTTHAPLKKSA